MSRDQISHGRAAVWSIAIFLYFVIFTAWLPSAVLRSSYLATAPENVGVGITVVVWGGFFVAGLVGLRWAQEREMI